MCACVRVHALLAATDSWVLSQLSDSVGRIHKVLRCEAMPVAPFIIVSPYHTPSQVFQQCPEAFCHPFFDTCLADVNGELEWPFCFQIPLIRPAFDCIVVIVMECL